MESPCQRNGQSDVFLVAEKPRCLEICDFEHSIH